MMIIFYYLAKLCDNYVIANHTNNFLSPLPLLLLVVIIISNKRGGRALSRLAGGCEGDFSLVTITN